MKPKTTILSIVLYISVTCSAADYYWVGGSGNWSDYSSHWATSSGGSTFRTQIPTPFDNVYFDANSFTAPGQTVAIDQTIVQCNNMDWAGVTYMPTIANNSSFLLSIYGSLTLAADMICNLSRVNFEATTPGHTITSAGHYLSQLIFEGIGGGWTLQDAFTGGNINLIAGNLDFNSQLINSQLLSISGMSRSLTMGSSIFTGSWRVGSQGFTLDAGTSTIVSSGTMNAGDELTYYNVSFTNPSSYDGINGSGNTFNNVSFAGYAALTGGNNTFNNITFFKAGQISGITVNNNAVFYNDGSIIGDNNFNNLTFTPGFTYTLYSGYTQTVNSLNANGNGGFPILITSDHLGNFATISKTSDGVCADFVRIRDIHTNGGAVFNAGTYSVDLGGNAGWNFNVPSVQYYADSDGDGYGVSGNSQFSCAPSGIYTAIVGGDCNDSNSTVHPGSTEICNGIDDNCNGSIDEGVQNTFYNDADGDGYGNIAVSILACTAPTGYVSDRTDCNDSNSAIHPGATEICGNSIDDDCDGLVDEGCIVGSMYRSKQTGNWNSASTWEVSVNGGLSWSNATTTPTFADATITIRNTNTVTITAAVTVDQVIVDFGGILTQHQNVTVNNGPGEDITVNGTYNLENSKNIQGSGSIQENAVFNLNAGDINIPVALASGAVLNMNTSGAKTLRSTISNNGAINWSDGNLTLQGGTITNNGAFTIVNSGVIRLLGGAGTNLLSNTATGTITKSGMSSAYILIPFINNGSIQLTSGTLRIQGSYSNYGTVNFTAGAVLESFNPGVINLEAGTVLSGTGSITNNQAVNVNTAINLPATISFTCFGDLGGSGSLTVNGSFNWGNGNLSCIATIASTGTLTITSGAKNLSSLLTNNGIVNWVTGNISFQGGIFTNNANFNISNADNLVNSSGSNGFINNANGAVTKVSGGANSLQIPFTNDGLIRGSGTLTFGTITNNGVIAPGLSLGIITVNSTSNLFSANSELKIEIIDLSGPGTGHDQLKRAGNLALNGKLTVTEIGSVPNGSYDIIRLTSGTISGSFSTLQLPPGYSLRIQSNNRVWLDKVNALRSMPNDNLITLQPSRNYNKSGRKISSPVIFPNPADFQINLRLTDEITKGNLNIQMVDRAGRMIKKWIEPYISKARIISLNTVGISSGLYILIIKDNIGKMISERVLIQH